ncbi:hypothetical protein [Chitinophaga sp. S165]|uniref:hypothetical protein n=1 Tax=Chitinophaga sp. S165 TaxID=2135462 RepID=UPI000D709F17|nr:hypothetical protein [Chitinophaga sp. S165]PWV56225.1 hypothetical protein C7475_101740 [Chitinophaga sp. S165]
MPKQQSIILLSGRMGDQVFYHKKDKRGRKKYYVRRAPEVVRQSTATKKTATDFGTASKASRLIRQALNAYTCQYKDETLHYRLNALLGKIIRLDTDRPAGQKRLLPEHMSLLTGFRFNSETRVPKMDRMTVKENTKLIAVSVNFEKGTTLVRVSEAITAEQPGNNELTLLLAETEGKALDIIDVLQPAPVQQQTRARPKLQVQPKSISTPTLLHLYAYPYPGTKHHSTARSARKRSPFLTLSAPLTLSGAL